MNMCMHGCTHHLCTTVCRNPTPRDMYMDNIPHNSTHSSQTSCTMVCRNPTALDTYTPYQWNVSVTAEVRSGHHFHNNQQSLQLEQKCSNGFLKL